MGTDPMSEIARAAALVRRAGRQPRRAGRQPRRVRVHPLDWALLKRRYGVDGVDDSDPISSNALVMGIPVHLDCAVRRGHPEADYED